MPFEEPSRSSCADGSGRFWLLASLPLAAIALAKGLRLPNSWSMTQLQIDYGEGFTRRGLVGATLKPLLGLNLQSHADAFGFVMLAVLAALLVQVVRRARFVENFGGGELVAVFATSYGISYFGYLAGYFDIPLLSLAIIPLFIRHTAVRAVVAVVCIAVALLTHELFLFAFAPLTCFSFLVEASQATTAAGRKRILLLGAVPVVLAGALAIVIALPKSLPWDKVVAMQARDQAAANVPLNPQVYGVLSRSSAENVQMMSTVWRRKTYVAAQVESLLMFLPCVVMLLCGCWLLIRARAAKGSRSLLIAGVLVTTFSPLLLHLVGWDKTRFNSFMVMTSFLSLVTLCLYLPGAKVVLTRRFAALCLLCAMLNMATGGGMLLDSHIRPFPFIRGDSSWRAP